MGFLRSIWARLALRFDPSMIEEQVADLAGNLIVATLTFLVFVVVARVISWVIPSIMERFGGDEMSRSFSSTMARLLILTIGAVAALSELGVNTPALITSMGVAGLTIGFAARDVLSNVVSGLFIFWDRPFVIGDLIDFDGRHGRVARITLRATRVVTPNGRMVSIPNSVLLNGSVTSYTNFPHLRIDVPIGVGVGEDLGRIRRILLDVVTADPDFMDDPAPQVVVTNLGDYNLTVELRAWLDNERQHLLKRPLLTEHAFEALRAAAVEMPYETLAIEQVERQTAEGAS